MNIISLASDLSKILQEQISLLNAIISLKNSLNKLVAQKELTEKWNETELTQKPCEVIDSKIKMIQSELKKLRYFDLLTFDLISLKYTSGEQVVNMKKMDSLRSTVEHITQRK